MHDTTRDLKKRDAEENKLKTVAAGSWKLGAAGSWKLGAGRWKLGAGSCWELEAGSCCTGKDTRVIYVQSHFDFGEIHAGI